LKDVYDGLKVKKLLNARGTDLLGLAHAPEVLEAMRLPGRM
jgi:hypothetical protein